MDPLIQCYNLLPPFAKAWLKKQLIHLKLYETRVRELKDGVKNLNKAKVVVHNRVDEEENRYGKRITEEVEEWLGEVNKIISEYEEFDGDELHKLAVFDFFTSGYLPKTGIRFRRSSKAYDIRKKVNELLKTAKHDTFSYWIGAPSMASFFSNDDYMIFESRDETKNKIIEELKKPNVRVIGLHGLSGVGKTSLVKQVAEEALEANMFNVVIMTTVTRHADIRKIQSHIAEMLGVKLEEESDIARALRIRKRLKNEKENVLIILDDLWEKLDFNMLGIPSENDDDDGLKNVKERKGKTKKSTMTPSMGKIEKSLVAPGMEKTEEAINNKSINQPGASNKVKTEEALSLYKECKVLLISEAKQVLLSQMEGKENSIFYLEALKETEAKTLFQKKAGIGDANPEFEDLATQIASKCEGLPMLIVTTARALKNRSRLVWEDAKRNLEWKKFTGEPEFSTKLSYKLLGNEELQYTFLLCARMGNDASIMDLVKYCIGLGFLHGIYTVREARDRVYALVGRLKESGLLSDSNYSNDHFTMQHIVRNAALSIASEVDKPVFTMTKGKVDEWPDEDILERYIAISLHHCDIIEGFPVNINFPRLKVFHVTNNDQRLEIPDKLFDGMKELKVLKLTHFHLLPLPSSIRCLTKLRMLCLEQCILGEELSIIGELKKLRILSLSGSDIVKLPTELEQLKKLQIFDISNCSKLQEIPSMVIKGLICLEELYMRNTLIKWNIEEPTNQSENASLSELRHLNQLTTLDIQIPNADLLPNNLFFDKLYSYKIVIGDLKAYLERDFKMPEKHEASRFLALQLKNGFDIHSQKGIKMLFDRVENLLLEDLNGVQDIFYRLNLKGYPYLKHLSIVSNSDIKYLINPKVRQHSEKVFPKLESLYLYNLKNVDKICSCKLSPPSFGKLKAIKIHICGQLKNVFLISVVRLLIALKTIEISECDSLKEIVPVEMESNTNEIEFLKLPELQSLTLQSLSDFIGFYPKPSNEGEIKRILFHDQVVVSKLERMELSLIPIDIIWSEQTSQGSSFRNLIHLDVNGCSNLKYLLSISMAKSLVNLQSLFISECENMGHIFSQGQDSNAKVEDDIFPTLKNIKLSGMRSLIEIWNSELPSDSIPKLDTLIIEQCDKLVNVFPCYMKGIFLSLCNLTVTNCGSMKEIFDLDDKKRDAGDVTKLQDVRLEILPKLKHVWKSNKDNVNFEKLQKIWIRDCDSLECLFPVSQAKCLHNLESLVVWDCYGLREIVAMGKGPKTDASSSNQSFEFPKLATIKFSDLPKLKSFYPGAFELHCPCLKDLSVENCYQLEPFKKETANATILFPEEVINKLKALQIESWHAKSSSSNIEEENYRRDNLEELRLSKLYDTGVLYSFLHNNPNLKSLSLTDCFFKEMVPLSMPPEIQKLGVVPKLKSLKLINLPKLEKIGFERDVVLLEKIEFLILEKCPCLETIVPSSVSLTHLTNLEVVNCDGLENLMEPSTAKSLIQLRTMKVINCEYLKEIVLEQGNEEEKVGKVEIVFKQLKALELVSLNSLESFCNSTNCMFEFPALEKLVVSACPKMRSFSEVKNNTPLLQKIYVVHEQEKRWYWHGNLQDTIQKIFEKKKFFEGMDEMSFSEYHEVVKAWSKGVVDLQDNLFYSLKTLKLVKCAVQPHAIPSNVLPYLSCLKELEVRNCNKVSVIFDMDDIQIKETTFQLKELTLEGLPNLTRVWKNSGQAILKFQNLQQVFVRSCTNLETLFPATLAQNLKKLEELEVQTCKNLLQIVEKKLEQPAEETEMFVFPCLTSLELSDLSQFTHFFPDAYTLECPMLNRLHVWDCPKLELFQSAHPLFPDVKAISNLEELDLDWELISMLRSMLTQSKGDLEYLNELNLFLDGAGNKKPTVPFEILQKAPNLEDMMISCCFCTEIFATQYPKIEDRMLGHLKKLTLYLVHHLQCIGSEDSSSWLNTLCEKLHQLNVMKCKDLKRLVHHAVSFSHLKGLYISECDGLEYLLTSSAAKKLNQLEVITVLNCKSMKEIVQKDETTQEGIIFERLYWLQLNSLSSLKCFYSGDDTLQLPSLVQVSIWRCHKMKVFSQGITNAKSFRGIQASSDSDDELVFHNDLNGSIKMVLLQYLAQEYVVLRDSPILQEIWLNSDPVVDKYFSNITSLVVDKCEFLSDAILPSRLLPFLSNLEELQVKRCSSLAAIFDMIHMEPSSTVSFFNLTELNVNNCHGLKYLFTSSIIKSLPALKEMCVAKCDSLEIIVAPEGHEDEEETFIQLENLILSSLPKLSCFYSGSSTLCFPSLKKMLMDGCDSMDVFCHSRVQVPEELEVEIDEVPWKGDINSDKFK